MKKFILTASFLSIIAVVKLFAMDGVEASVIFHKNQGVEVLFNHLQDKSKENGKTLIETMLESERAIGFHDAIIRLAFNENKITPKDLMYVIKQYSINEGKEPNSTNLFMDCIIHRLDDREKAPKIRELLKEVSLQKKDGNEWGKEWGPDSVNEKHNVLVSSIEEGYFDAFRLIIEKFSLGDLTSIIAVTRDKKTGTSGYLGFREFTYEPVKYTLIQWLLRDKNNNEHYYFAGAASKDAYVKAGAILANFIYDKINKIKDESLSGEMLNMLMLLVNVNQLPKNIQLKKLVSKMTNLDGVKKSYFSGEQQARIKENLPESLQKAWVDLK